MATKLTTDGQQIGLGTSPDLKTFQEAVGGYIEAVYTDPASGYGLMYVNEEGRRQGLQPNQEASALANKLIVGDVMLLTVTECKGDQD